MVSQLVNNCYHMFCGPRRATDDTMTMMFVGTEKRNHVAGFSSVYGSMLLVGRSSRTQSAHRGKTHADC